MVDVVGIGDMGDHLSRRRIEDADHLLFLGKGKMYELVEGKTFNGEATTQSTEGFVLLKDYGAASPYLTSMCRTEASDACSEYYSSIHYYFDFNNAIFCDNSFFFSYSLFFLQIIFNSSLCPIPYVYQITNRCNCIHNISRPIWTRSPRNISFLTIFCFNEGCQITY